jgi:TetR/AcrR family transcriptional regulator, tetracycline repressor protein
MTGRRRPALSRAAIVDRAIALADAEGLATVTVRRLAREHGVSAMAFYAHFQDKEEILDAMARRLLEPVELPPRGPGRWDDDLHAVLTAFVAGLRRHPSVAVLTTRAMLECDAGLRISERVLGLLGEAGYRPETAASVCKYLLSALIAMVTGEPGRPPSVAPGDGAVAPGDGAVAPGDGAAQIRRSRKARLAALPPEQYPHVVAAAEALTHCADVDTHYARGIRLLVCGLRSAVPE